MPKKWEVTVFELGVADLAPSSTLDKRAYLELILNQEGEKGWEPVCVVNRGEGIPYPFIILKKEKNSSS